VFVAAALGCREDSELPTGPRAEPALAVAANAWTPLPGFPEPYRADFSVGAAPNRAGQWIVYVIGGQEDLHTGFGAYTYNVSTESWGGGGTLFSRAAYMNGVGKIGNKLYFTGGEGCCDIIQTFNTTWVYDIGANQLTRKADMPKATTRGVTGVIDGKLYVVPGDCSGAPGDPGRCSPARQLGAGRRRRHHNHGASRRDALGGACRDGRLLRGADPETDRDDGGRQSFAGVPIFYRIGFRLTSRQ